VRKHEFTRRPPHGQRRRDGAAAAHAGARLDGDFLLGKQKKVTRPKGGKSIGAIGVALARDGFRAERSGGAE